MEEEAAERWNATARHRVIIRCFNGALTKH